MTRHKNNTNTREREYIATLRHKIILQSQPQNTKSSTQQKTTNLDKLDSRHKDSQEDTTHNEFVRNIFNQEMITEENVLI